MLLFEGVTCFTPDGFTIADAAVDKGSFSLSASKRSYKTTAPSEGLLVFPGFADVHTHLREPGFSYKETIATGTEAAAAGGFTIVCAMPNLNPVPDSVESLKVEENLIAQHAKVRVYPYGALTVGEKGETLSDMEALAPRVVAFSDDGRGIQKRALMKEAMLRAKALNKLIAAHCEDETLRGSGCIRSGRLCAVYGVSGIPAECEWRQVERDIELAAETGARYHVCHVSTKESVSLIREAKKSGVRVSAETAPHYLTLTQDDMQNDGRFKMNPPLGDRADRDALVEALGDGTIDIVATDHAPHTTDEKSRGIAGSLMGITGLETAFSALYTRLVKTGEIELHRLIEAMTVAPRRIFGLPQVGEGDYALIDLSEEIIIKGETFRSMGKSTPYEGKSMLGKVIMTILNGEIIWKI